MEYIIIVIVFMIVSLIITGTFDPIIVIGMPLIVYVVDIIIKYFSEDELEEVPLVPLEIDQDEAMTNLANMIKIKGDYLKVRNSFLEEVLGSISPIMEAVLPYDYIKDVFTLDPVEFLHNYFGMKTDLDLLKRFSDLYIKTLLYENGSDFTDEPLFRLYTYYNGEKVLINEFNLDSTLIADVIATLKSYQK